MMGKRYATTVLNFATAIVGLPLIVLTACSSHLTRPAALCQRPDQKLLQMYPATAQLSDRLLSPATKPQSPASYPRSEPPLPAQRTSTRSRPTSPRRPTDRAAS